MPRHRAFVLALRFTALACCLGAPAAVAAAQSARDYRRSVESVSELLRTLTAEAESQTEALHLRLASFDTVDTEGIRFVAARGQSETVREGMRHALARARERYGTAVNVLPTRAVMRAHYLIVVAPRAPAAQTDSTVTAPAVAEWQKHWQGHVIALEAGTVPAVSDAVYHEIVRVLAEPAAARLSPWLNRAVPIDPGTSAEWAQYRVQLVSFPSVVARECYAGQLDQCKRVLGLIPVDDPASELHDAGDRRRIVRSIRRSGLAPWRDGEACIEGDDDACFRIVRARRYGVGGGLPVELREALTQEALRLGGEGALERLLTSTGTVAERLERAGGVPIDRLVESWRSRLIRSESASNNMTPLLGAVSIFWAGLFGALSLRSSRWR